MSATAAGWQPDIHVLVPAYRAARSLRDLLPQLLRAVPASNILVVDDGSEDDTASVCVRLGVSFIGHDRNRGKGAALRTGFDALLLKGAAWVVTMDADGQHAVSDLGVFTAAIRENPGMGICIGRRSMKIGAMPVARILSNTLTSVSLSFLCGCRILDSQCGYRAYSADFLRRTTIRFDRFEMETEVILKACRLGFPVVFAGVQTLYLRGESHISHLTDTMRWIRAALSIVAGFWLKRREWRESMKRPEK